MTYPLYYLDIGVMWTFFKQFPYNNGHDGVEYSEVLRLLKEESPFRDVLNTPNNNIEMMFELNDTLFKTEDGMFNLDDFKALCLVVCRGETDVKVNYLYELIDDYKEDTKIIWSNRKLQHCFKMFLLTANLLPKMYYLKLQSLG